MEKKISDEEKLFNMVEAIGETLNGGVHIIDNTEYAADEKTYRVYHKDGYCFDIKKEPEYDDDDKLVMHHFSFYAEWEGFKKLDVRSAMLMLTFP